MIGDGLADGDAGDAGDGDDVADRGLGDVGALEAVEGEELGDLGLLQRAVALGDVDLVAGLERAVEDAGDAEAAEVVGVVEIGDQDLERAVWRRRWRRDGAVTMVSKSGCRSVPGVSRDSDGGAVLGVGVEDREVELVFVGVEVDEEVVDLVRALPGRARRDGRSC